MNITLHMHLPLSDQWQKVMMMVIDSDKIKDDDDDHADGHSS